MSPSERYLAYSWGNKHPYLLQLACFYLFEAKQQGKSTDWAYEEFKCQADNVPTHKDKFWYWLIQKVQALPIIGGYLKKAFNFIHNWFSYIITISLIIIVIFSIFGEVDWNKVKPFFPFL